MPRSRRAALTLPPGFMPITALEMACGGLGPDEPANRPPPPLSPTGFITDPVTNSPTTNSSGCGRRGKGGHGLVGIVQAAEHL